MTSAVPKALLGETIFWLHHGRGATAGEAWQQEWGARLPWHLCQEAEEGMLVFDLYLPLRLPSHQPVEGPAYIQG